MSSPTPTVAGVTVYLGVVTSYHYPAGATFAFDPDGNLAVLDSEDKPLAVFRKEQWQHVELGQAAA